MTRMLEGRVALVTGAGSGIGRDIALALAAAGAKVAVTVRRAETGGDVVDEAAAEGGEAFSIAMDVADPAAVEAGIAATVARFGSLDIVIHNANNSSSAMPAAALTLTREDWLAQSRISVGGAFLLARAAYPHLARSGQGRFVLMTSDFGYHGAAMNTIYAAQKASFRAFIKSLAREWGGEAITVNALSPSAATPPTRIFFDQNPAARDAYLRKFPLRRMGDPRADIAEAAVLLCSQQMGYLTGQTLFLDGGLYPSA